MNFEDINKDIRTNIHNSILNKYPMSMPNMKFAIPNPPEPYIRVSIKHGDTNVIGCGAPKYQRSIGVVIVQVFIPEGRGDAGALSIADEVCTVLDNKSFDLVTFQSSRVKEVGVSGGFYQLNVVTSFSSDKITQ